MEESQNLIKMIEISVWVAENNQRIINRNGNSGRIAMGKRKDKGGKTKRCLASTTFRKELVKMNFEGIGRNIIGEIGLCTFRIIIFSWGIDPFIFINVPLCF